MYRKILCGLLFLFFFVSFNNNLYASKGRKVKEVTISIPDAVIENLKEGKLDEAAINLRLVATSPRAKFLLRCTELPVNFEEKFSRAKQNQAISTFNVGAAYHNLYLFLLDNGYTSKVFFNKAQKYYKKAIKNATPSIIARSYLSIAALNTSNSDFKKAQKYFNKVIISDIYPKTTMYMTLAMYFAATGDTSQALANIKASFDIDKEKTRFWLGLTDDFYNIWNEPSFQKMLKKNKAFKLDKGIPHLSSENSVLVN